MYSMDKRVRFSTLLLNLVSQKDSREALNFILGYHVDYLRDYSYIMYSRREVLGWSVDIMYYYSYTSFHI